VSDAFAWRSIARRGVGAGFIVGGSTVVLVSNFVLGVSSFDPVGWGFATAAFWGLLLLWLVAASLWPLLFDPVRAKEPVTNLVRLAVAVAFVKPLRYVSLMIGLAVVLVLSTILAAALLTVSVAFACLVLSFYAIHT